MDKGGKWGTSIMTKKNLRRLRRLGVVALGLASFAGYLILNPESYQAVIEA